MLHFISQTPFTAVRASLPSFLAKTRGKQCFWGSGSLRKGRHFFSKLYFPPIFRRQIGAGGNYGRPFKPCSNRPLLPVI